MSIDRRIRNWNHRRIDKMRSFKLALARWLFTPFSRFVPDVAEAGFLVLRLDGKLGDGVTATGFLRELKLAFPNRPLTVVTGRGTESIYQNLKYVDEVYVCGKGLGSTLLLFFQLKKKRYSCIINTSHILNPRVLMLVSLLPAFKKISFANENFKNFSDYVSLDFKFKHVTERYRDTLKILGIGKADLNYELATPVLALPEAENLRRKAKYLIALNSFAGARLRNLNSRTTATIVRKLLDYPEVYVISTANEGDHKILNTWIGREYEGRWVHYPQFCSVEQNLALVWQCDLIITPDTAWVHLASALKKKLVAVYREETNDAENNAVIWGPYGTEYQIIRAPNTAENPQDINNVNTDDVVAAAVKMLSLVK